MSTSSAAVAMLGDSEGWIPSLDGGILHLRLSRPPVNAINTAMWWQLDHCIKAIYDDDAVRVVVITSDNPRVFSAGQDYKDVGQDDGGAFGGPNDRRRIVRDALTAFYEAPVPTVVGVTGRALGSGAVLAALADLVVGGPSTRLGLPEIDRGIIGGSRFLSRLVPAPMMRRMILLGGEVTGEALDRVGSLAEFVPDDEIERASLDLGKELGSKHPVVMRLMKRSNVEVEDMAVMAAYTAEQKYSVIVPASVRQELIPARSK